MMHRNIIFLFLLTVCVSSSFAKQQEVSYQLLLAGGALKTCSSLSPDNCIETVHPESEISSRSSSVKLAEYFQVSNEAIQSIIQSPYFSGDDRKAQTAIAAVLLEVYKKSDGLLSKQQFVDLFKSVYITQQATGDVASLSGSELYKTLSDHNWYLMLDYLQQPQIEGERKREQVKLNDSIHYGSPLIFGEFVSLAARASGRSDKPVVLFSTASSRDPFDAVDFYQQALEQAGAEAIWLPLDVALAEAIAMNKCEQLSDIRAQRLGSVRREVVYPDLVEYQLAFCRKPERLLELVNKASGLFINGGDQSLTLTSFRGKYVDVFEAIKRKLDKRELVVGGTSAGAAVQSGGLWGEKIIPMITSGDSYTGLKNGVFASEPPKEGCDKDNSCKSLTPDSLTFRANGGLGFLNAGIFDTHFSERARQARLILLAIETGIPFAFGIDETTALLVGESENELYYRVVGENGVWMFDLTRASFTKQGNKKHIGAVLAHFLSHNDQVILNRSTGEVRLLFAEGKLPFAKPQPKLVERDVFYYDAFRSLAHSLALSKRHKAEGFSKRTFPQFKVQLRKTKDFESRLGIYRRNQQDLAYVSYKNLEISIQQLGD